MNSPNDSGKAGQYAAIMMLTDEDLMRVTTIDVDRDAQEALAFVRERIMPEIRRQQNSRLKGVLDGGTGGLR